MAVPRRPRTRHEFSIALICALRKESDAVLALFDGHWRDHGGEFSKVEGDGNIYSTGWIGEHNVVLVQMPGMGNTNAAGVSGSILASFPRIRLSLVVGICGGVPGRTKHEMILGDVVISTRIFQLNLASRYPDALVMKNTYEDQLGRPTAELMAFMEQLQGRDFFRRLRSETAKWANMLCDNDSEYHYPGKADDTLYEAGYRHKHQDPTICAICASCDKYDDPVCEKARRTACTELQCDRNKLVIRQRLQDAVTTEGTTVLLTGERLTPDTVPRAPSPMIHFGPVGSGDWVIKSQIHRDTFNHEVIAYEMEGSGVSLNLPTLVVKSVCDYADSHKNKDWQNYAAAIAAACMKAVLHAWPKVDYSMNHGVFESIRLDDEQVRLKDEKNRREEQQRKKDHREWYLQALRFEQIEARFEMIKKAHRDTCRWLLARPEYRHWLVPNTLPRRSFFWIKGKPGAGKSTVMKFLLGDIEARAQKSGKDAAIVVPFFFNARGDDLEKSTAGLYRALLFHLLSQVPSLQSVLDYLPRVQYKIARPESHVWTIDRLRHLFEQAVNRVKSDSSLICVVDALDECEEAQIREMVTFFESLSGGDDHGYVAQHCFRTCFSSRHYPNVTINNSIELVLEDQDDHRQDIANYLRSGLKGRGSMIDEMKAEILERSSGIFLWVCLVVNILNAEYDHGRIHSMRQRLDEIPTGLDELFYNTVTRDTKRMDELILTLRLLLFAARPLKPNELCHAIVVGTNPESVTHWKHDPSDEKAILRFISSTSKGLAEITKDGTVQFIHESVRDYLLTDQGLQRLWPDLVGHFEVSSQDMLAHCCLIYIDTCISQCPSLSTHMGTIPDDIAREVEERFPFLTYAATNVFFHADAAALFGIDQLGLIENFPSGDWVSFRDRFRKVSRPESVRPGSELKSSLYIFARENLGNLAHIECLRDRNMGIRRDDYEAPLSWAIHHKNEKAIRALLTPAGGLLSEGHQLYLSDDGHEAVIKFLLTGRHTVRDLYSAAAADHDQVDVMTALLRTKKVRVDGRNAYGRTPLWKATRKGNCSIVKVLLKTGQVNVNAADENGRTPLTTAARWNHLKVMQLLLETGQADVNLADNDGCTPLINAAKEGFLEAVQLLVETNQLDVNIADGSRRTPLSCAAAMGNSAVVHVLLERCQADVNLADCYDRTPLMFAAALGFRDVVQMILQTGKADVGKIDCGGETAMGWAFEHGHLAIFRMLRDWMARNHFRLSSCEDQ